ncbi:MAG: nuclear transport factor 2 family protein [Pyrinomonadaceae bacterium]
MMIVTAASSIILGQAKTKKSADSSATKQQSKSVEQELMQLERDWAKATVNRDASALDRIEADDYIFTDADGSLVTKKQDIADITSGNLTAESINVDEMKVRVFGDTAVVIGRTTVKAQYKGKDISGQYRVTDVFLKRNGKWQAVASHFSRITQQ